MKSAFDFEYIPFPSVEDNPRNGEGDVIELNDGRLLMVYGEFLGPSDAATATLQGVTSSDGGRTWKDKHLVQENIGELNIMSVSLARLPGGDILLLFLKKDGQPGPCTPYLRRSSDEGKTWSPPQAVVPESLTYYVVNNDRLVQLKGGRLLIPAAVYEGNWTCQGNRLFISDDLGNHWRPTKVHPFLPHSKSGAQEPGVVELKDGRVMMWCRCDLGEIYRCDSRDGGETFGPWQLTGLKAPCSPATIQRLPSTGDLLCIFNNHAIPPEYWAVARSPLTAAISSDEAASWKIVGDLEPDRTRSYCYTSVTFLPRREILLAYYHGRYVDKVENGQFIRSQANLSHLKVGIFSEDWLYRSSR